MRNRLTKYSDPLPAPADSSFVAGVLTGLLVGIVGTLLTVVTILW